MWKVFSHFIPATPAPPDKRTGAVVQRAPFLGIHRDNGRGPNCRTKVIGQGRDVASEPLGGFVMVCRACLLNTVVP